MAAPVGDFWPVLPVWPILTHLDMPNTQITLGEACPICTVPGQSDLTCLTSLAKSCQFWHVKSGQFWHVNSVEARQDKTKPRPREGQARQRQKRHSEMPPCIHPCICTHVPTWHMHMYPPGTRVHPPAHPATRPPSHHRDRCRHHSQLAMGLTLGNFR